MKRSGLALAGEAKGQPFNHHQHEPMAVTKRITRDQLRRKLTFCRASHDLASYKRPRRIIFVESLPTNPSGKVLKRELIARYSEAVKT